MKLKKLVELYQKFIFISPHLDDAILSCAGFVNELIIRGKQVTVVTVFTAATNKTTSFTADFLHNCSHKNAQELFFTRKNEDIQALTFLKSRYIHLGFIDAAWRSYKERMLYQTEKAIFAGKVSIHDLELVQSVKQKLYTLKLSDTANPILILAPLGIGRHVDHVLVNQVVRKLFQNILFWEDYPYNLNKNNKAIFWKKHSSYQESLIIDPVHLIKQKAIRYYQSQLSGLFKHNIIPIGSENFYICNEIVNF